MSVQVLNPTITKTSNKKRAEETTPQPSPNQTNLHQEKTPLFKLLIQNEVNRQSFDL
jgi:hypothetical protein